jgi:PAS domain S-box-containing protein
MNAINSSAIIAVTNQKGEIISVNDNFCAVSGFSRDELLGKTHGSVNSGFHRPDFFAELWRTISSGGTWRGEIQNRRKDGSNYWVNTVISPMRGFNNSIEKYMSVSFDITEQKTAQRQLIEANRLSAISKIYENMAHEINNPLAIALGNLHQAAKKLSPHHEISSLLGKNLNHMDQALGRISHIVRSLQWFGGNIQEESHQLVSSGEIIDNLVKLVSERLKLNGIELQILGVRDAMITCRLAQIDAALFELVQNSIDALAHVRDRVITIESREVGDMIEIAVTDTGNGVRPEIAEKIMDPFFTTKSEVKGVGLGLSIAKGLLEGHNGRLFLDQSAKNTRFVVQIPHAVDKAKKRA